MCMFFTLNHSSTRRHPAHPVTVPILHAREKQPLSVVTNYDTDTIHTHASNLNTLKERAYERKLLLVVYHRYLVPPPPYMGLLHTTSILSLQN